MVRRWSYINAVNCGDNYSFRAPRRGAFNTTMNTTMYLKRFYKPDTRITRNQWARRKHITNWLSYSNVLRDWAASYRFHRNHGKLTYFHFFTNSTFLAFNVVSATGSVPALGGGSEHLITGSFTRQLFQYFTAASNPRLRFLSRYRSTRLLATSTYGTLEPSPLVHENPAVVPLLFDNFKELVPYDPDESSTELTLTVYKSLLLLPLNLILSHITQLYQTCVLLTVLRVKK